MYRTGTQFTQHTALYSVDDQRIIELAYKIIYRQDKRLLFNSINNLKCIYPQAYSLLEIIFRLSTHRILLQSDTIILYYTKNQQEATLAVLFVSNCSRQPTSDLLTGYTGCPGRNVPDFGSMFLKLKYTDINHTYIQSWTVMKIMAKEVWKYDSCYTLIDY